MNGGDIYVAALSSIIISESSFQYSDAQQGALLFAESLLGETITMQGVQISDFLPSFPSSTLVRVTSGTFILTGSSITEMYSPLFHFDETQIKFDRLSITSVYCVPSQSPFCFIKTRLSVFQFTSSFFYVFKAAMDFMVFSLQDEITLQGVGVATGTQSSASGVQIFILRCKYAKSVLIESCSFSNLYFSILRAIESQISFIGSSVDYGGGGLPKPPRIEILEYGSNKLKMLVLESCNSTITGSTFDAHDFLYNNMGFDGSNGAVRFLFILVINSFIIGLTDIRFPRKPLFIWRHFPLSSRTKWRGRGCSRDR